MGRRIVKYREYEASALQKRLKSLNRSIYVIWHVVSCDPGEPCFGDGVDRWSPCRQGEQIVPLKSVGSSRVNALELDGCTYTTPQPFHIGLRPLRTLIGSQTQPSASCFDRFSIDYSESRDRELYPMTLTFEHDVDVICLNQHATRLCPNTYRQTLTTDQTDCISWLRPHTCCGCKVQ